MPDSTDLVVVYTGNFSKAGLVKSCLDDGGISAYIQDEIMSTMHPVVGQVRVAVSQRDANKAKRIVQRFEEIGQEASKPTMRDASEEESGGQPGSGWKLLVSLGTVVVVLFAMLAGARWISERQSLASRLDRLQDQMYAHYDQGQYRQASDLAKDVLRLAEERYGLKDRRLAPYVLWMAYLEEIQGNYGEVVNLYKRAIEFRERAYGQNDPEVVEPLFGLAGTYYDLGQYREAEPLYRQIIDIRRKRSGPYNNDLSLAHWRLGDLYERLGQYDAAETEFQQAVAIRSQILGSHHLGVAAILSDYSIMLRKAGKTLQAEQVEATVNGIRSTQGD